jgi:hypothetical protein
MKHNLQETRWNRNQWTQWKQMQRQRSLSSKSKTIWDSRKHEWKHRNYLLQKSNLSLVRSKNLIHHNRNKIWSSWRSNHDWCSFECKIYLNSSFLKYIINNKKSLSFNKRCSYELIKFDKQWKENERSYEKTKEEENNNFI